MKKKHCVAYLGKETKCAYVCLYLAGALYTSFAKIGSPNRHCEAPIFAKLVWRGPAKYKHTSENFIQTLIMVA